VQIKIKKKQKKNEKKYNFLYKYRLINQLLRIVARL
jgi:hypothetical protein